MEHYKRIEEGLIRIFQGYVGIATVDHKNQSIMQADAHGYG